MSRKIWRKLGLVAMCSGTAFAGLGCISGEFLRNSFVFSGQHAIYDTFLAGLINGAFGVVAGGA